MRKEIIAVRNMYMGYEIQLIQIEEGKYAVELVHGDRYVGTFSSGCIGQKSGEYWMEYWTKWMKRLLHLCDSINMASNNILVYSTNLMMDTPKHGFEQEWAEEQAELEMLQDWFKELIERQGDSCKFLLNEFSEYLADECNDCPHWTIIGCDGDLVTEEWARKWMADQGENEYGIDAIISSIDRLEDLTPAKFMEICRDHWDR